MKDLILLELARRWELDAETPRCEDGATGAQISNAKKQGIREGKRECADGLRMLIGIFGGETQDQVLPLKDITAR